MGVVANSYGRIAYEAFCKACSNITEASARARPPEWSALDEAIPWCAGAVGDVVRALAKANKLPRYDERKGWIGGDPRTLYAFTGNVTGEVVVQPGGGARGIGPTATVAVATRAQAEKHWQSPLHAGWKVS